MIRMNSTGRCLTLYSIAGLLAGSVSRADTARVSAKGEILMPVVVNLPSEFKTIYTNVLKTTPREGTIKLITNELTRRLSEYKLIEKKLAKKYGMSFEEFKRNEVVKKENHSFEVEEDYCDWELAIDGIAVMKKCK